MALARKEEFRRKEVDLADFAKALALGADGIAVSNAALQAIGCIEIDSCLPEPLDLFFIQLSHVFRGLFFRGGLEPFKQFLVCCAGTFI